MTNGSIDCGEIGWWFRWWSDVGASRVIRHRKSFKRLPVTGLWWCWWLFRCAHRNRSTICGDSLWFAPSPASSHNPQFRSSFRFRLGLHCEWAWTPLTEGGSQWLPRCNSTERTIAGQRWLSGLTVGVQPQLMDQCVAERSFCTLWAPCDRTN